MVSSTLITGWHFSLSSIDDLLGLRVSGADLMLADLVLADLFWEPDVGFVNIPRGVCTGGRGRGREFFDDDLELVVAFSFCPGSDALDFGGFVAPSDVSRSSLEEGGM